MNNKFGWKELFFSVVLSTSIIYVISLGLLLKFLGFNFLGLTNFLIGGLAVYYLCVKYFERETKKKK